VASEIAIGLPVHNGARYLRQALDSLLAQTWSDFQVLILDDGSTDSSDEIIREYVAKDLRLHYVRLEHRAGLVEAWRRVAQLAGDRFQPEFFAWYSDHDWVAPDWLELLRFALRGSERTAMVHARTRLVDVDGADIGEVTDFPDTTGLPVLERLDQTIFSTMGAGDAVYGLCRWSALRACGIFHDEIMPDRLLIAELNLHGDISRIESAVRFRRQMRVMNAQSELVERQLITLFPDGYVKPNPYFSHATFFLRRANEGPPSGDLAADLADLYLAFMYFQRSLRKFEEPLEHELATVAPSPSLLLAQAIADKKIRLIYEALDLALARALPDGAQRESAILEDKIRALTAEVEVATAGRLRFETELVDARMSLKEAQKVQVHLEGKLAGVKHEAETQVTAAREEARALAKKLHADTVKRSETKAELARVRLQLTTTRQELAAVQLRSLAVAEQLEAAAARIAADESELSRLRAQLKEREAAALKVKGQRDHLQQQVASLKQHRHQLERRYRLVRVLGPAGFAAIKIGDRVGALRRARRKRPTER
jgi:glycosyltransferase involved in cell wall biosynthesis